MFIMAEVYCMFIQDYGGYIYTVLNSESLEYRMNSLLCDRFEIFLEQLLLVAFKPKIFIIFFSARIILV